MKAFLIFSLLFSNLCFASEYKYVGLLGDVVLLKKENKTILTKIGEAIPGDHLKVSKIVQQGKKFKVQLSNGVFLETYKPVLEAYKPIPNPLEEEEVKNLLRGVHQQKAMEAENEKTMEIRSDSSKEGKNERGSETNSSD